MNDWEEKCGDLKSKFNTSFTDLIIKENII